MWYVGLVQGRTQWVCGMCSKGEEGGRETAATVQRPPLYSALAVSVHMTLYYTIMYYRNVHVQ